MAKRIIIGTGDVGKTTLTRIIESSPDFAKPVVLKKMNSSVKAGFVRCVINDIIYEAKEVIPGIMGLGGITRYKLNKIAEEYKVILKKESTLSSMKRKEYQSLFKVHFKEIKKVE